MNTTIQVGRVPVRFTLRKDENIVPLVGWDDNVYGYRAEILDIAGKWMHLSSHATYAQAAKAIYVERDCET